MDALELKADVRQLGKGHAKNLRREGLVPAVMYGKGNDAELLQIEARTLDKVLSVTGTHQLIALKVANQRPVMTLARDIQRDPIKRDYLHVDFYMVQMDQKVTAQVPIILEGEAPGVTELGGVLTQGLDELEIECLPGDLISSVIISVESLHEFNDTITVADLTVPETVTILSDTESMVAKIEAPRKLEDLEALDEEGMPVSAEPELVSEAEEEFEEE